MALLWAGLVVGLVQAGCTEPGPGEGRVLAEGEGETNTLPLWPLAPGAEPAPAYVADIPAAGPLVQRPAVLSVRAASHGGTRYTLDWSRWNEIGDPTEPVDRPVPSNTIEVEVTPSGDVYRVEMDGSKWLYLPRTVRVGMVWDVEWSVVKNTYMYDSVYEMDTWESYLGSLSSRRREEVERARAKPASPPTKWRFAVIRRFVVPTLWGETTAWAVMRFPAEYGWGVGDKRECFFAGFEVSEPNDPVMGEPPREANGSAVTACAGSERLSAIFGATFMNVEYFLEGYGPLGGLQDLVGHSRQGPGGLKSNGGDLGNLGCLVPQGFFLGPCPPDATGNMDFLYLGASRQAPWPQDEKGEEEVFVPAGTPNLALQALEGGVLQAEWDFLPNYARFTSSGRESVDELLLRGYSSTLRGQLLLPNGTYQDARASALVDFCVALDREGHLVPLEQLSGKCPDRVEDAAQPYVEPDGTRWDRLSVGRKVRSLRDAGGTASEAMRQRGFEALAPFVRGPFLMALGRSLDGGSGPGVVEIAYANKRDPRLWYTEPEGGTGFLPDVTNLFAEMTTLTRIDASQAGGTQGALQFAVPFDDRVAYVVVPGFETIDTAYGFVHDRSVRSRHARVFWFGLDGTLLRSQILPITNPGLSHRDGEYLLTDVSGGGDLRVVVIEEERAWLEHRGYLKLPEGSEALFAISPDLEERFVVVTQQLRNEMPEKDAGLRPCTQAGWCGSLQPQGKLVLYSTRAPSTGVADPLMMPRSTEVTASAQGVTACSPDDSRWPVLGITFGTRAMQVEPLGEAYPGCVFGRFTPEDDAVLGAAAAVLGAEQELVGPQLFAPVFVKLGNFGWLQRSIRPGLSRWKHEEAAQTHQTTQAIALLADGSRHDGSGRSWPYDGFVSPQSEHIPEIKYPERTRYNFFKSLTGYCEPSPDVSGLGMWFSCQVTGEEAQTCVAPPCPEPFVAPVGVSPVATLSVLVDAAGNRAYWSVPQPQQEGEREGQQATAKTPDVTQAREAAFRFLGMEPDDTKLALDTWLFGGDGAIYWFFGQPSGGGQAREGAGGGDGGESVVSARRLVVREAAGEFLVSDVPEGPNWPLGVGSDRIWWASGLIQTHQQFEAQAQCIPFAELCNGKDDDCSGLVDDGAGASMCDNTHGENSCMEGRCVLTSCQPSWDNCNGMAEDGCETQLGAEEHCLACGDACPTYGGSTCLPGGCAKSPVARLVTTHSTQLLLYENGDLLAGERYLGQAQDVAAGHSFACLLHADGEVGCCAENGITPILDCLESGGNAVVNTGEVMPAADRLWAGEESGCLRALEDGAVFCWGKVVQAYGSFEPSWRSIPELTGASQIAFGGIGTQQGVALAGSKTYLFGPNPSGASSDFRVEEVGGLPAVDELSAGPGYVLFGTAEGVFALGASMWKLPALGGPTSPGHWNPPVRAPGLDDGLSFIAGFAPDSSGIPCKLLTDRLACPYEPGNSWVPLDDPESPFKVNGGWLEMAGTFQTGAAVGGKVCVVKNDVAGTLVCVAF